MLKAEKLRFRGWSGLFLGFGGMLAVFFDSLKQSEMIFVGTMLAVLAAVASALGTVYIRAYLGNYDIAVMAAIQMSVGAAVMLIAALAFEPIEAFKVTYKSAAALLYLAVFGTVIAFLGYYWLLKRIRAIIVSQIAFITPIIAVILGYFAYSEIFNPYSALGAGLILIGVVLVAKR